MAKAFSYEDDYAVLRWLYYLGGYIPAVCAVLHYLCLLVATIQFGHLPVYGRDKDLEQLAIGVLALPSFILAMGSFVCLFYWPWVCVHLLLNKKEVSNFSYLPIVLFCTGISLYFIAKYTLPAQFDWLTD